MVETNELQAALQRSSVCYSPIYTYYYTTAIAIFIYHYTSAPQTIEEANKLMDV